MVCLCFLVNRPDLVDSGHNLAYPALKRGTEPPLLAPVKSENETNKILDRSSALLPQTKAGITLVLLNRNPLVILFRLII
jgi:hypothetical protein